MSEKQSTKHYIYIIIIILFTKSTLEEKSRGAQAEKLALSQLYRSFLLARPAKNECVFERLQMLLEVSGGFAEL